jgi:hypothetical protein
MEARFYWPETYRPAISECTLAVKFDAALPSREVGVRWE